MPSAYAPHETKAPKKTSGLVKWGLPIACGVVGISLAIGGRWLREGQEAEVVESSTPPAQAVTAASPSTTATAPAEATGTSAAKPDSPPEQTVEVLPLTSEDKVNKGEGILEIVAGKRDQIYVNGKLVGNGPVVKVPLPAKAEPYEIRVKLRGEERVRYALVQESKRVRLRVAPPWSR